MEAVSDSEINAMKCGNAKKSFSVSLVALKTKMVS